MSDISQLGPLAGLRVIDFGQYIAGPGLAMMLADQGAEVIRVDPPGGPMWSSPANSFLNRNKKSIILNLKKSEDRLTARKLVSSADIVVENFRPGVMGRLDLGPEAMTGANPKLIYVSIPGFASTDKDRAHLQAWEGVIGAATGLFIDQGVNRLLMKDGAAYYTPLTLASAYAISQAATVLMAALLRRERTGRGDIVEVPIAAAVLEGLVYNSMAVDNIPERYASRRSRELERRLNANEPLNLSYDEVQALRDPTYKNYFCADGRGFYNETVGIARHVVDGLKLHRVYDDLVEAGMPIHDVWTSSSTWKKDGVPLGGEIMSDKWAARIEKGLEKSFKGKTSREWESLYEEHNLAGAAQQTTKEWLQDDHADQSGLIVTVNDLSLGRMKQPGSAVWLKSSSHLAKQKVPAAPLDADREEILASLENITLKRDEERSSVAGPPLAGLKILDLSNVLGGPTIAATLARFGADVIHVQPPLPAFEPGESVICGAQCGKGKRSILVDLKSEDGRAILLDLVKSVDLVTYNGTDKQVRRLHIEFERLQDANPDIVFCQLTAFDGPFSGPRSNRLGYDDLAQAITGVMVRAGGGVDTPEEHAHIGTIDVMGGFLGAFASLAALYKRARGEGGDHAKTSLVNCAQMIQFPFMYDYEGRGPFDEPSGPDALGERALYRLYKASDAWFFLGAKDDKWPDIAELVGIPGMAALNPEECEAQLESCFADKRASYWVDQFVSNNIGAHTVDRMADVRRENTIKQSDAEISFTGSTFKFLRNEQHPSGYVFTLFAPVSMRLKHSLVRIPSDQVKFGANTREVLAELGYGENRVNDLIERGVVATAWTEEHLLE